MFHLFIFLSSLSFSRRPHVVHGVWSRCVSHLSSNKCVPHHLSFSCSCIFPAHPSFPSLISCHLALIPLSPAYPLLFLVVSCCVVPCSLLFLGVPCLYPSVSPACLLLSLQMFDLLTFSLPIPSSFCLYYFVVLSSIISVNLQSTLVFYPCFFSVSLLHFLVPLSFFSPLLLLLYPLFLSLSLTFCILVPPLLMRSKYLHIILYGKSYVTIYKIYVNIYLPYRAIRKSTESSRCSFLESMR